MDIHFFRWFAGRKKILLENDLRIYFSIFMILETNSHLNYTTFIYFIIILGLWETDSGCFCWITNAFCQVKNIYLCINQAIYLLFFLYFIYLSYPAIWPYLYLYFFLSMYISVIFIYLSVSFHLSIFAHQAIFQIF